MLSRAEAKVEINKIIETSNPIKTGQTLPIRPGETFNVYRIPLHLLVPNVLNDRITWRIREYEAENQRKLNIDSEEDVEFLYSLIFDEHKKDNERTEADIAQKGQMVDGVITNEGIIIDGNRRATLLRDLFRGKGEKYKQNLEKFRYFNAIVLPENIGPKEIMALETMIQVGADKPVEYNRICLYIKIDNLLAEQYTYTQIKQYMNLKSEKDVEEMKEVYDLMVQYLKAIRKPNHFTLLDGLEDQFINTKKVFKNLDNGTYKAKWEYSRTDVANFKEVCFDYMRSKFEGKKFRDILVGKPSRTNGVFIEKKVWEDFLKKHNEIIDSNNPQNEADWQFLGRQDGKFNQNLNQASKQLESVLDDKNFSALVHDAQMKINKMDELTKDLTEVASGDLNTLKQLVGMLNNIISKFSL